MNGAPSLDTERVLAGVAHTVPAPRAMTRLSPLDAPAETSRAAVLVASTGALLAHAALALLALTLGAGVIHPTAPALISELIEVELPRPPAPPPPVEAKQPKPRAPEPPRVRAPEPAPVRDAPPPAAAQAARVLAAAEEVVDFGDSFVAGSSTTYAGGVTEPRGTSQAAVRDTRARAGGVEGGTGSDVHADLSRSPVLAGGGEWDCPFPEEADDLGIDRAVVTLRIDVGVDGSVTSAAVTRDPGDGFGREARRCALRKRWSPGLDRAGRPMSGTAVVNVRFER